MRRLSLPFFSILVTTTLPISPVLRTCVPPQGCVSTEPPSPMRTRRTLPVPIGGFTDMVRTRPGLASSSASLIQRSLKSQGGAAWKLDDHDVNLIFAGLPAARSAGVGAGAAAL